MSTAVDLDTVIAELERVMQLVTELPPGSNVVPAGSRSGVCTSPAPSMPNSCAPLSNG